MFIPVYNKGAIIHFDNLLKTIEKKTNNEALNTTNHINKEYKVMCPPNLTGTLTSFT